MQAIAYTEIVDFVSSGPSLKAIVDFRPSTLTLGRVAWLEQLEQQARLNTDESFELQEFRKARDFLEALKLRAARRLKS